MSYLEQCQLLDEKKIPLPRSIEFISHSNSREPITVLHTASYLPQADSDWAYIPVATYMDLAKAMAGNVLSHWQKKTLNALIENCAQIAEHCPEGLRAYTPGGTFAILNDSAGGEGHEKLEPMRQSGAIYHRAFAHNPPCCTLSYSALIDAGDNAVAHEIGHHYNQLHKMDARFGCLQGERQGRYSEQALFKQAIIYDLLEKNDNTVAMLNLLKSRYPRSKGLHNGTVAPDELSELFSIFCEKLFTGEGEHTALSKPMNAIRQLLIADLKTMEAMQAKGDHSAMPATGLPEAMEQAWDNKISTSIQTLQAMKTKAEFSAPAYNAVKKQIDGYFQDSLRKIAGRLKENPLMAALGDRFETGR